MNDASNGQSQRSRRRKLTPWMVGVGAVTFLAGLLFGYDQGVIWVENGDRMLEEEQVA